VTIAAEGDSMQPGYPWREISLRVSGGKFMSANRRLESFRRGLLTSNRIGQYYRAQEGLVIIISARGV
jgi:hypothetical protein